MATFPLTTKYFLHFRHSDTGLTPSFTSPGCYFRNARTLATVTPPTVLELAGGTYYFQWTWTASSDDDIVFEVDGGASIPTEEVRYIADAISPRDFLLDDSIGNVRADITAAQTAINAHTDSQIATHDAHITSAIGALVAPDNASITAIKAKTDLIPTDFQAQLARILGLDKENSVLDQTVFDGQGNLQQGRLRLFPTATDALAGTNATAIYDITASWAAGNIQNYTQVKRP